MCDNNLFFWNSVISILQKPELKIKIAFPTTDFHYQMWCHKELHIWALSALAPLNCHSKMLSFQNMTNFVQDDKLTLDICI